MRILVASILSLVVASSAFATDYKIDGDHSTVGFKIRHLAISSVPGRFAQFNGTFAYDPAHVEKSKVDANIEVKSITTEQQKRDDHLRSPDFFDVAKFPEMKFVSREVNPNGDKNFQIAGDLTIKDVTKPVTLDVEYQGTATDPWGNERAAFSAVAKLNRKDFGLTWNKVLDTGALVVGDEVSVMLEIEGIKQKA